MGDEDVTLGEVYRLAKKIDGRFDTFAASYVPVTLFQAIQKTHDDNILRLGREIGSERADRKAEGVALRGEIDRLEERVEADKRTKAQQWFAIGLASFVSILSIIGSIVAFTINNRGG